MKPSDPATSSVLIHADGTLSVVCHWLCQCRVCVFPFALA
jgi:hypothetical protein